MGEAIRHPKTRALLKRLAQTFRSSDARPFVVRDSDIVFLCGGRTDADNMRTRFYEYAKHNLPKFRIFLAERAFEDYRKHVQHEIKNLAEFEDVIAAISTCVILFPESPGSFAELGYFANSGDIKRKLLIVNNSEFQGDDSFIALGPVRLVDKRSKFQPTIQIEYRAEPDFVTISKRLDSRIGPHNRRSRFSSVSYDEMTLKEKLYVVFEIVRIFQVLTFEGVHYAFRSIWKHARKKELTLLLSILVASNYVARKSEHEDHYFCVSRSDYSFLHFDSLDINSLMLQVVDIYESSFPELARLVRNLR